MSTFTGLSTMVRGILSNQTALNTTGHNITNASTEGYSRQSTNLVSANAEIRSGIYGSIAVGTGVETQSITRSRDIFADKQFRDENSTQSYYETIARNYDSLEVIFNDAGETGMATMIGQFYKDLVDLSTNASDNDHRSIVVNSAKNLCDLIHTNTAEVQKQINAAYDDMALYVNEMNETLEGIVNANKLIVAREALGANANDLRDQRDLLVDQLSKYLNVNVSENSFGSYQITSGGVMLVNGIDRLHFEMSRGLSSASSDSDANVTVDYGVSDYNIVIKESKQIFVPQNGILKAELDIVDECKSYIDHMANIANFMLTTFNDQHHAGYDAHGKTGGNFFGDENTTYEYAYDTQNKVAYINATEAGTTKKLSGVKIIEQFAVNSKLLGSGYDYVAAATKYRTKDSDGKTIEYTAYSDLNSDNELQWSDNDAYNTVDYMNGTVNIGDGTNAVYLSELFNMSFNTIASEKRANAAVIRKYADNNTALIEQYGGEDSSKAYVFFNSLNKASINDYYSTAMTNLAVDANTMDNKIIQQEALMVQIQNWRDSTSGVDWNEELTNMIRYQKGFQSCARCLTAMDECLDRLVNSTGMVGR